MPHLPRFRRVSTLPSIRLTTRDREIIRFIGRHRFVRSHQIIAWAGGSSQQILRRLQLLYHHRYLERPRAQLDYYHRGGSRQIVYGLGKRGGTFLQQEGLVVRANWGAKNRSVGRTYLEHALLVSEVMTAIEQACRISGIRLLTETDLNLRRPLRWSVSANSGVKLGIIPDSTFGLEYRVGNGPASYAYFFLEADRGTMPVKRTNLTLTSFYRKFVAYQATWAAEIYRTRFGFHRFRVLAVTTSPKRRQSLMDACKRLPQGQGLFLFADKSLLDQPANLLSSVWLTAQGEFTSLIG